MAKKGKFIREERKDYQDLLNDMKQEIRDNKYQDKKSLDSVTYYSSSTTDFMKGINEMRDNCDEVAKIIGDVEVLSIPEATELLTKNFLEHVPSLEEKKNLMWSLNVSSTRCILKTGNKVTFGWKLKYNKSKEGINISEIVFQITLFGQKVEEVGPAFDDLNWHKEVK